jgi:cytochrome c oxidase subunit 3
VSERPAAPAVAHQFDDAKQQYEAATLGMWAFLITEVMFFGGLFVGFFVYVTAYSAGFAEGSRHLSVPLGTLNTGVLLGSSLTMALAVRSAQRGARAAQVLFLLLTIGLGLLFLGVKGLEYAHKFHEGLVPGRLFTLTGPHASSAQLFFSFYFAMTGVHALHMIIGVGILAVLVVQAARGRYTADYFTPVEVSGLYWHFVDVVWIFLFPLLYLVARHQ